MGDFNVNVDEVRAHAQTVGEIAANVRSVAGSAQDSVSGGAFGEIAEFFASAITGAADMVRQNMTGASQAVDQVQTGLKLAADGYQMTEDEHVRAFNTAGLTGGGSRGGKPKAKLTAAQQEQIANQSNQLKTITDTQSNAPRTSGEAQSTSQRKAK